MLSHEKENPMEQRTLAHNRALMDDIISSGMSRYYNTEIVDAACEAIEAELRRRGIL